MWNLFNRIKAVQYAQQWALSRNPDFPDYSSTQGGGGDYANFVSQVMMAGGWGSFWGHEMDPGVWWCRTDRSSSWSWKSAMRLRGYLDIGLRGAPCDPEDLDLADIVFQKIEGQIVHAMVVTAVERYRGQYHEATDNFYLSYHSRDTKNRPLREILKLYDPERCTYEYWKVANIIPEGRRWMMPNEGTPPDLYRTYPVQK